MYCYLGVARNEILASALHPISVDQSSRGYANYDDPDLAGELAPSVQCLGRWKGMRLNPGDRRPIDVVTGPMGLG